jgi:hypothetical protein
VTELSVAEEIGATTLSIMPFSRTTFSLMTYSIKGLYVTLNISDTQHKPHPENNTAIMLNVIMLSVIMLSVITLSVITLSVIMLSVAF